MSVKLGISPSEESRLMVSENRAMKDIFGPQKEAVKKRIEGKLHNYELRNL
jgi:hypothetical protein